MAKTPTKPADDKLVRLAVNVPTWMRRQLKIHSASTGETISTYIVRLLEKDGVRRGT